MADDLRRAPAAEFWRRFEAMLGDDGLVTYRYLGRRTPALHDVARDTMKLRRDMRNAAGGLLAAPLAIASAEAGGRTDRDAVPAPVTYSLRVLDAGHGVREIEVRRAWAQLGRTLGFSEATLVDAERPERVIGIALGSGVKLADAPPGFRALPLAPEIEDSPELPPLHEVFGARRRSAGIFELPALNPRIASTSGTLHLGPLHVLCEAAALDLAAPCAAGATLQVESWDVLFVGPGRTGPFAASGEAFASPGGRVAARVAVRDEGQDERLVARCVAVFRRA